MKLIKLQCPSCGGVLEADENVEETVCSYCGTVVPVKRSKANITTQRHKLSRKALVIFGAVAAVIIIVAVSIVLSVTSGEKIDPRAYKKEGVYLVGQDIPAGEYVLYPHIKKGNTNVEPVFEVRLTRDRTENASDFLYSKEFYMRQYVNLSDGQYLAFEHALLYLPEKVKLKELDETGYSAAQLKVGADIEAGEYVIAGENKQAYYFVTSTPEAPIGTTAAINAPEMLSFGSMENRVYVRVEDGQYLTFGGGKLYRLDKSPAPIKREDGSFAPGQYKVGTDIKSGKYEIKATENNNGSVYVCINKNSVKTSSLFSSDAASGAETLLSRRLTDLAETVQIEIPKPQNGDSIYVTFYYCTATQSK